MLQKNKSLSFDRKQFRGLNLALLKAFNHTKQGAATFFRAVQRMKNLAENNLIRFTNVTRKKDGLLANFKVKGLRNGVVFSASISVDITALELNAGDSLEKIIEDCARHGLKEFKKADFQFEGISVEEPEYLGVAQLG